ncbi:excitatory amino acid transporter isoform X2 [Onthophagus taurus]|nr:excitatory amino acid transporter isoform X2 [Onthophagus taurus]XP_022903384.1 excitatory amino acid transporter isoform X2 [Onthophagus taurus]
MSEQEESPIKIDIEEENLPYNQKNLPENLKKWFKTNILLLSTVLAVIFGVILGFLLKRLNLSSDSIILIQYPGEIFMRLLKLIILPLIISSLIAGSASLNARLNGKIAVRTLLYFLVTSGFNAVLGVLLAVSIHPGNPGLKDTLGNEIPKKGLNRKGTSILDALLDLGRNIITENIFQATFQQAHTTYTNTTQLRYDPKNDSFNSIQIITRTISYRSGTNTMGIVFFCLIFGTILGTLGAKSKILIHFFTTIFDVVMKMVNLVMFFTPLGICSVIAGKILSVHDLGLVLTNLTWFIITVVVGVFFYQLIVIQSIYFLVIRKNPFKFYLGLFQGMITSFATASTAAALPVTFKLMENNLKIDPRVTRFVLPIGCNINMDGTALFIAIASVFIAQMNGIQLSVGELITVCFTSTAASFSSASVPSAALVLLLMVLSSIDTPNEDVSLLFAVDWIVDRFRTTNNMLGDCYTAAIVEHLSKDELKSSKTTYQDEYVDEASLKILKNDL